AVEHAERGVLRSACHLLDQERAACGVEQHQVGVRAPDVDSEPIARGPVVHAARLRCAAAGREPADATLKRRGGVRRDTVRTAMGGTILASAEAGSSTVARSAVTWVCRLGSLPQNAVLLATLSAVVPGLLRA